MFWLFKRKRLERLEDTARLAMSVKRLARELDDRPLEAKASEDLSAILEQMKALVVSRPHEEKAREKLDEIAKSLR